MKLRNYLQETNATRKLAIRETGKYGGSFKDNLEHASKLVGLGQKYYVIVKDEEAKTQFKKNSYFSKSPDKANFKIAEDFYESSPVFRKIAEKTLGENPLKVLLSKPYWYYHPRANYLIEGPELDIFLKKGRQQDEQ